jgi:exodeoxyribonuclease V alpha subunit
MEYTDSLSGTVEKIVYQNSENGFTIFTLTTRARQQIAVRGYLPHINAGEFITVDGSWLMHPKFGKQFDAKTCTTQVPDSILGLKKYLGSGLIKGIGPAYAEKLVAAFGTQVLVVIDKEPHRLSTVPGIGKKRIESILKGWLDQKEISHIMVFLQDKGVSTTYATKIYKKYGSRAIDVVTENPYRLADDIWGIGFKIADALAQRMDFEHDSLKRITAGVLFSLNQETTQGHLYCLVDELKKKVIELLELETDEAIQQKIKTGLHNLYNSQKIVLISPTAHEHLIALTQHYYAEKGVANKLLHLQQQQSRITLDIHAIYDKIRVQTNESEIVLNDDQQRAIMNTLSHKISIITGGPGTGKTTIIKKIISILEEYNVSYKLAAPTGRAAKRMSESTHRYAETIHRLLEFDVSIMGFGKNESNALAIDFLIIDESSMIDVFLAHHILKAVPYHGHVLFIGDIDQLPSVGAGNFLKDMIASTIISCAQLTQIFRQAHDSLIIRNAHRVNNGEFPHSVDPDARRDFYFIKEELPENVPGHLEKVIKDFLPKYGIKANEAMILTPMNRGSAGTQKINSDVQQMVNPYNNEQVLQHGGTTFKINDRVMQLRNNYDKMVFNGDIGTITDMDTQERKITVNFYDKPLEYEYSEMDELTLAYAVTIHKSQGSEYGAAIILIFAQHFTLLQRNLLYTAITRAKRLCIIIGQAKAIGMAVKNNKSVTRKTLLQQFLMSDLKCR